MQMEIFSATNQKIGKLSIVSSESSDQNTDFPSLQPGSEFSMLSHYELEDLFSLMKSTLSLKKIQLNLPSSSIETLKYLIETLCSEYSKEVIPVQEIYLKNIRPSIEEISVNLMRANQTDPISKVFAIPESGVFFSSEECKSFSALVIGAVRDSASHCLHKKIVDLQEKVIALSVLNNQLKGELRGKCQEVEDLVERIKGEANRESRRVEEITMSCENSMDKVKTEG